MTTERFDAIVIGTGQAGPALAVRLAGAGRKTAILERQRVGGTCVNTGCIPTKTLIASARAAYVGLEFAQMYRRFGSRVTVVEMAPRIVAREDPEVSAAIQTMLEGEGVAFRLKAECLAAHRHGAGVTINISCEEEPREIAGSHLLLAVGRNPNTHDLGLDKAGVATDKRGFIKVDDELCTSAPGVWALGDVNGRGAFTHTSYNDYEIVAANLLDGDHRRVSDRVTVYALFTDP